VRVHREGQLGALRARLSDFVEKTVWGGQRDLKDVLEKEAEKTFGPCLRQLWVGGEVTKENYRKCMEEADLRTAYKRLWGK